MSAVVLVLIVLLSNGEVQAASHVMASQEECHTIGPALAAQLEKREDVLRVGGGCLAFSANEQSAAQ